LDKQDVMGNSASASKAEDDENSFFGKGGKGEKLLQDESLLSGGEGISYENDSLTCPGSKSTLGTTGTEFTGPKRDFSKDKMNGNRMSLSASGSNNKTLREPREDDMVHSGHITDDQVHVNLAMADLMAYLQVVANNSNNLPLTRRDDPELGRTVSNLTSDEYARKSAAFIPSDVRVIGGSFTRYGRVWDLPTSEEFNACDGAQEPGKLSVLWDLVNVIALDVVPYIYFSCSLWIQVGPTGVPAVMRC
jgi:hypothetical protein